MGIYTVSLYTAVILSLFIRNLNGQLANPSSTSIPLTGSEPAVYTYGSIRFKSKSITSGPIQIVDQKTIFIPNLHYNGRCSEARFWVGNEHPSSNGTLVPDENHFDGPLKNYQGQNIYLQLPENLTVDHIDYLGIWEVKNKTDLGHVMLHQFPSFEDRINVPDTMKQKAELNNKTVFRIPSCCAPNKFFMKPDGRKSICVDGRDENMDVNLTVWKSNETHIDPDELIDENIDFVFYHYYLECEKGTEALVLAYPDIFGLIFNSSFLYYIDFLDYGILNHGSYCVANRNNNEYSYYGCLFIGDTSTASVTIFYFPFLIISTMCFFGSAIVYIFLLKEKNVHRKCFVGYSISMTVTFVTLILLQKVNGACNFIGGLFMVAMICSFVWLACLCIDLIYVVRFFKNPENTSRIYIYLALSLAFPVIILLISIIPNGIPDVPKSFIKDYSSSVCSFHDYINDVEVDPLVLFIPIGILISISVIGLVYTSYIINKRHDPTDYEWLQNKSRFKFMLIQCILICIIMTTSYVVWVVLNLLYFDQTPEGLLQSLTILESMQGILFILIIFGHNWGNNVVERRKFKCSQKQQSGSFEMTPLNGQVKPKEYFY